VKRIKKVFSSHDQVIHLWANQSQANARLIASAPELLEMLVSVAVYLENTLTDRDADGLALLRELDALITKATGGAE
jgi:hypothetical protein